MHEPYEPHPSDPRAAAAPPAPATLDLEALGERIAELSAQIQAAQQDYRRRFGCNSPGIWLGECAYDHRVDAELKNAGFQYFFTDAHMAQAGTAMLAQANQSTQNVLSLLR